MPDLNKVILLGRLTRDPELRYTPQEKAVCDLGIATARHWKNLSGERKSETTYTQVTLWGKQAELVCKVLEKGDHIFVEGRLHLEKWEGPNGDKRQKMKVMGEQFQFLNLKRKPTDKDDEYDVNNTP